MGEGGSGLSSSTLESAGYSLRLGVRRLSEAHDWELEDWKFVPGVIEGHRVCPPCRTWLRGRWRRWTWYCRFIVYAKPA